MISLQCQFCGKEYKVFPHDAVKSKYCSMACYGKSQQTRPVKRCLICGKHFRSRGVLGKNKQTRHCSKECADINKKGKLLKWNPAELEIIKQKLKDGCMVKDIAKLFNKNPKTMQDLIFRQGWSCKINSDDFRLKCKIRNKKLWNNPEHIFNSQEYRNKLSAHHQNPNHVFNSSEYRQMLSDRAIKNQNGLKNFNNRTGWQKFHGGFRKDLGFYVRSRWEANIARYLNFLKQQGSIRKYKYEADTFMFHEIKRGNRSYTPDFKVYNSNGSIEYWEIKGYMDGDSQTKIKRLGKYYPQIKLIVISREQYKEIKKYARLIEGWEE